MGPTGDDSDVGAVCEGKCWPPFMGLAKRSRAGTDRETFLAGEADPTCISALPPTLIELMPVAGPDVLSRDDDIS